MIPRCVCAVPKPIEVPGTKCQKCEACCGWVVLVSETCGDLERFAIYFAKPDASPEEVE